MKQRTLLSIIILILGNLSSQTPTYEFITEPIDLIDNYYDYMPGSYCALPIQIEEDGGVYIVFHSRETAVSTRRIYYSYIDAFGNMINTATISTDDIHEGYPGIDIDLTTGDPMVAWYVNIDISSADNEIVLTYDLYHLGSPGLWRAPFTVFSDTTPSTNMPADEFIWPEVHIGPSPIPDKRRVYVIGKNYDVSPTGNPSENVLIGFADFDENDLIAQSDLDWTYSTIELLDQWHNGDPEWVRPFISCAVSDDGQIAFMGYTIREEGDDSLAVFWNDNFGEGEFEYLSFPVYDVESPWTQFQDLSFQSYNCNNQNSIFHDDNSKISWVGNLTLMNEDVWFSDSSFVYPKVFTFDVQTEELSFYDLYIEGANPSDDIPMLPWDLDEDGLVDSIYANGEPNCIESWPIYYFDEGVAFWHNYFHLTKNEEKGWLAVVWSDGLKARKGNIPLPGYIPWCEVPEIAICISANNGVTWSQPIFLNALETPELANMIPEYVYPGDKIEDLGNDHGKLHLFFLDDYIYGSQIASMLTSEGMQKYCSLDINFGDFTESPENTIPISNIHLTNYPNPFNPSTTISFSLTAKDAQGAKVKIYNLKGQKIRQYSIFNSQYSITWDGTDQTGKPVASGVYFAKLKAGNQTTTRKMLLIK